VIPHVQGAFPVDVHVLRQYISTGVLQGSGVWDSTMLAEHVRKEICKLCYENKWNVSDMAHAHWFLGRGGCKDCDKLADIHLRCPISEECGGRIESHSYFDTGHLNFDAPRRSKGMPVKLLF